MKTPITFSSLIAPLSLLDFENKYYEKEAVHITPQFGMHFSISDFHLLLAGNRGDFPIDRIGLSKGSSPVEKNRYFTNGKFVDYPNLVDEILNGHSVIFNRIDLYVKEIECIALIIQNYFNAPTQCNAYLSPPHSAALDLHYDSHDVIVLQVEGEKEWELFNSKTHLFSRLNRFSDKVDYSTSFDSQHKLESGSLIYVPRGKMHRVKAGAGFSLHLTFGILGTSMGQIGRDFFDIVEKQDVDTRKNINKNWVNREDFKDILNSSAKILLDRCKCDEFVDEIYSEYLLKFSSFRRCEIENPFIFNDAPQYEKLRLNESIRVFSHQFEEEYHLTYSGKKLSFPVAAKRTIEFILEGKGYLEVCELEDLSTNDLDWLYRKLFSEGVVTQER